jgi:lipoate---protein ligase
MTWNVEQATGPAGAFHSRPLPDLPGRAAWFLEVDRPALVLGSTQRPDLADREVCAAAGVDVVVRRSGGGAVLLVPGEALWVDLIVPAEDPLWEDDVGRAAWWIGDLWAAALTRVGVRDALVHRGPMVRAPWADLVCFAGLAPGEVTVAGKKVVGISQRRTRDAARFQCVALARWDPVPVLGLLALGADERRRAGADLAGVAAGVPLADLAGALRGQLDLVATPPA